jgi:5-methylcytosine-specific restriction enzyme B
VALRRRFAFLELLPEPELLDSIEITAADEDPLNVGKCLRKINQRINELRGPDYQIGHSYFLPIKDLTDNEEKLSCLDEIWNYQIVALLKEYFYGQSDLLCQVLPSFFEQENSEQDQKGNSILELHADQLVAALNKL